MLLGVAVVVVVFFISSGLLLAPLSFLWLIPTLLHRGSAEVRKDSSNRVPGTSDSEVLQLRWRSDNQIVSLSEPAALPSAATTSSVSDAIVMPLYIATSTLSGPSNQLFGMINSLALALEDDTARARAVFFPLEAHYLWAVGCTNMGGAIEGQKHDKKTGSAWSSKKSTPKCPDKAYDLPVAMFLNSVSPIVRYRIYALDANIGKRRALFRPSELTICSSYGSFPDLDAIRVNNTNVGLMLDRIRKLAGLASHSAPNYSSLRTMGVQLQLSEHKELQCIRDSIRANRSVVAIMYDHDLCASRNILFASHSGDRPAVADRQLVRFAKGAVIEDAEQLCPRTSDVAALGNLIFSKGSDYLRKLVHFSVPSAGQLMEKVRQAVFIQLRVPDEDIFHSAKQWAKESQASQASSPGGPTAYRYSAASVCPDGSEYCDNTSIAVPLGGRRSTDALINRCRIGTLGQLMDRIARAASEREIKFVSIISNSLQLKLYSASALSKRNVAVLRYEEYVSRIDVTPCSDCVRALEREWLERALAAEARAFVSDAVSSYGASINFMRGDGGGTFSITEFVGQGHRECG